MKKNRVAGLPLVSVVIPAFNAAATIGAAVRSVSEQTIDDIEIIVVDDGSRDNTARIVASIHDPRVHLIIQENGGASNARNTGITAAKGSYIALLDADDLWLPTKLERQLLVFENDSEIDAVKTGAYYVNDSLDLLSIETLYEAMTPLLDTLLFRNVPAVPSTLMTKRDVFERVGLFDPSTVFLEDWEFLIRLARYARIFNLSEPLALYRIHPGNRSRDLDGQIKSGLAILKRLFNDPDLPANIRLEKNLIYATFFSMLSGGALNLGLGRQALKWGAKAIIRNPRIASYMVRLPFRKFRRRGVRRLKTDRELSRDLVDLVTRIKENKTDG